MGQLTKLGPVTAGFDYGLTLDEYSEKYAEWLKFERDEGVLTVRLHTNDGPAQFTLEGHHALGMAWQDIGRDPFNEVVIITGTGGEFLDSKAHLDERTELMGDPNAWVSSADQYYQISYADSMTLFESFFNNIQVPTIGALSTPGDVIPLHIEVPLACDIVLCSETTIFGDGHFADRPPGTGVPCGDGQGLVLEALIGNRRAAYLFYTGKSIDAQTALDWGIVNEVLPQEKLLPRCQEIARHIIEAAPPISRKLQSQLIKRPWKQRIANDFQNHLAHEMVTIAEAARGRS